MRANTRPHERRSPTVKILFTPVSIVKICGFFLLVGFLASLLL